MAKHESALEGSFKFTAKLNQYSIKITSADYDTGKIEGSMQGSGVSHPFLKAGYSRESAPSTRSSLTFRVQYDAWDPEAPNPDGTKGHLTVRTGTLSLTADDHSYNNFYGTLTEDGAEPIDVALSRW